MCLAVVGVSGGAVAGIIIGSLVAVLLVMVLAYFLLKNRQSKALLDDPGLPPTTGFDNVLYTPSLEEVQAPKQLATPEAKPEPTSDA